MSKVSKKVLTKIKKGEVERLPKWRFVAKRIFIWGSLVIAVLMGAFAVSMVLFQLFGVDWDVLGRGPKGTVMDALQVIPYFWMVISALLFVFVYFDFRHTRKGHRYSATAIILSSVVLAAVLGTGIYAASGSRHVDEFLGHYEAYQMMHYDEERMWAAPENGLLGGEIIELDDGEIMLLQDFIEQVWTVDIEEARCGMHCDLEIGEKLKIIGEIIEGGEVSFGFKAEEIRPFRKER